MKSRLMSDRLMTGLYNNTSVRWYSKPIEPSPIRGICYGIVLSLPFWGLLLTILL
jgi:hypothetical protein